MRSSVFLDLSGDSIIIFITLMLLILLTRGVYLLMCLSAVYEVRDGKENLVCEHATAISLDGGVITLTDLLGEEIVVTGILKSIDLIKNIIKIEV